MKTVLTFLCILVLALPAAGNPPAQRPLVDQWWLAVNTMADARSLMTAVEAYAIDNNRYPAAASVEELRKFIEPMYIKTAPMNDKWGTPFLYRVSADGKSYTVASAGSDRTFDESAWPEKATYSTTSREDLVYQHGEVAREWVIQRVCP
jgi:Type II secretion system (T2SS), protein G